MKIKIAGKYYEHFNDVTIATAIDSVASTFAFTVYFDPSNPEHRFLFKPLSYHRVEFSHDDGQVISTGTITYPSFNSDRNPNLLKVNGYSLGGVLEDCEIPFDMYPLQSDNRTLKEIAERLLKRFKLSLRVYDSAAKECNEIITKSVAEPGQTIKDYLSKIAAQKNVIFSHDVYGGLIFFRPDDRSPSKGLFTKENAIDFGGDYNGQGLHSLLTTIRQPSRNDDAFEESDPEDDGSVTGTVESVTNPLVGVYRPHVEVQSAGKETDTSKGVRNSLANELKNLRVGFTVIDKDVRLSVGDMIEVQNDEVYLYEKTRMMVSNTIKSANSDAETLSVTCVLPETFTGKTPKLIFG